MAKACMKKTAPYGRYSIVSVWALGDNGRLSLPPETRDVLHVDGGCDKKLRLDTLKTDVMCRPDSIPRSYYSVF